METEDDYFRAKREYKKDLKKKVFQKLAKEAKKRARRKEKGQKGGKEKRTSASDLPGSYDIPPVYDAFRGVC